MALHTLWISCEYPNAKLYAVGPPNQTISIVCRAFQGIGASGIYAIGITMMYELVPANRYPFYASMVMVLLALSFALGPVFGGLITQSGSWRWVFLLKYVMS